MKSSAVMLVNFPNTGTSKLNNIQQSMRIHFHPQMFNIFDAHFGPQKIFVLMFWTHVTFVGPMIPLFLTSGNV